MRVTQFRKPLLSVAQTCDENNRVAIESTDGYVEHVLIGEKVYFHRHGNLDNLAVQTFPTLGFAWPEAE